MSDSEAAGVPDLAALVVQWQKVHGRNDLPWQNTRDPYRVWLSEVMLQQTQVSTVQAYFLRFLEHFPDVVSLAQAPVDDVLAMWSGLGYYSRARHLHQCARAVVSIHQGNFPRTADVLQRLPGIGRSTAAAIASLCFGERVAILDANVKRVLTRVLGFGADLSIGANERRLWQEATRLLPLQDLQNTMPRYTQGVMDLGATVCTAKKPDCPICPLKPLCSALRLGQAEDFPVKTRKVKRKAESVWMLWAQAPGFHVFLCKRPSPGVWAGLYCFPLFSSRDALMAAAASVGCGDLVEPPPLLHVLTHKDLHLHLVQGQVSSGAIDMPDGRWFAADEWPALGLPAPIRKLLLTQR